jgi:hypothetical protein
MFRMSGMLGLLVLAPISGIAAAVYLVVRLNARR